MTLRVEICGEKTLLERKKLKGKKKKRKKSVQSNLHKWVISFQIGFALL